MFHAIKVVVLSFGITFTALMLLTEAPLSVKLAVVLVCMALVHLLARKD